MQISTTDGDDKPGEKEEYTTSQRDFFSTRAEQTLSIALFAQALISSFVDERYRVHIATDIMMKELDGTRQRRRKKNLVVINISNLL